MFIFPERAIPAESDDTSISSLSAVISFTGDRAEIAKAALAAAAVGVCGAGVSTAFVRLGPVTATSAGRRRAAAVTGIQAEIAKAALAATTVGVRAAGVTTASVRLDPVAAASAGGGWAAAVTGIRADIGKAALAPAAALVVLAHVTAACVCVGPIAPTASTWRVITVHADESAAEIGGRKLIGGCAGCAAGLGGQLEVFASGRGGPGDAWVAGHPSARQTCQVRAVFTSEKLLELSVDPGREWL